MISRTGLIATKIGMTSIFNSEGILIPVTILNIKRNVVIGTKTQDKHGYNALVIGYGHRKNMKKPLKGIAAKAGIDSFSCAREFRVSNDCFIEIGSNISINHFIIGQLVDITATSIGKGFAGAMKRHNYSGLEASHGVSISHRSPGSTGNRQDPGRVFKGKKMPGHMGSKRVTKQNMKIIDIDNTLSLIAIHGAVPGAIGTLVTLKDAIKSALPFEAPLPAKLF